MPGHFLDNPYDDAGIHPTDIGNPNIWGTVMDWVFGGQQLYGRKTNNFVNTGGLFPRAVLAKTPAEYDYGITIEACNLADGWPITGSVVTTKQADGVCSQTVIPNAATGIRQFIRCSYVVGNYFNIFSGVDRILTLLASWIPFDASSFATAAYYITADGEVVCRGLMKGGTVTVGTVFAILSLGYRPPKNELFICATNAGTCRVQVDTAGNMSLHTAGDATFVSLSGIRFRT